MFSRELLEETRTLLLLCHRHGLRLVTAESCTGGLVTGCLTEIPGASNVLERGFIVYANEAKEALLGVSKKLIETHGAVSEAVARAMAEGALASAGVDLSIATTGIAGPGGGTQDKPVGLVHLATAARGRPTLHARHVFSGDRTAVRLHAVQAAIGLLRRQAEGLVS